MRNVLKTAVAAVIAINVSVVASAAPMPVTLVGDDFNNLLGGSAIAVGSPLTTDMSLGNLQVEVVSQAFTDEAGSYMYLYQIENTGGASNSAVEVFACSPFFGASGTTTLGYLTADAPSGFTLGAQTPYAASVDAVAGPTVSFVFPAFLSGYAVDPGEYSYTLYVLSDSVPGTTTGNVINGEVGSGDVVGAIPEPATMGLLSLGGVIAMKRRRKVAGQ